VPTVAQLTDPYRYIYTQVPPVGPGVCDVCHSAPGTGYTTCYSCTASIWQVSRPVRLVVPISLYRIPGQLHHVLRNYKDGRDAHTRDDFQLQIAALLTRFLSDHDSCIRAEAGVAWDVITTIPSSGGRAGPHPLELAIGKSPYLASQFDSLLAPGSVRTDHNRASDRGYIVTQPVRDRSVLLVDDTFTSGARAQSAASALQLSGARVVAMVPVGRVITPDFSPETEALWERVTRKPFDFGRCCLEP
jgi:hypothetical protein